MYGTVHCYPVPVASFEHSFGSGSFGRLEGIPPPAFRAFDLIVIAASAGGISALISFLSGLPPYFPAPIVVAQHLSSRRVFQSSLHRVLQRKTSLKVQWATDGEIPVAGYVYIAPQDRLTVLNPRSGSLATLTGPNIRRYTPTANPLFESAARFHGNRTLALVLSGALKDGAVGAAEVARVEGRVLVQSYSSSEFADMPRAAVEQSQIALAFDPLALAHVVITLVMAPGASEWFRVGGGRSAIANQ